MKNKFRARLFFPAFHPARILLGLALVFLSAQVQAQTLRQLMDQSRRVIGDSPYYTSVPKLTDAKIISWLNEGQNYAAAYAWGAFTKRITFSLVAGTTEYTVPGDFETVRRLTLDDSILAERTLAALDSDGGKWIRNAGKPSTYYVRTTTYTVVGFNPAPTVNTTGTINLDYYAQVAELVEMSDIPFNGVIELFPLHPALPKFVAYRFHLLSGSQALADVWAKEYAADIKRAMEIPGLKPNYLPGFQVDR